MALNELPPELLEKAKTSTPEEIFRMEALYLQSLAWEPNAYISIGFVGGPGTQAARNFIVNTIRRTLPPTRIGLDLDFIGVSTTGWRAGMPRAETRQQRGAVKQGRMAPMIRIGFQHGGAWSVLGNGARHVPTNQLTMNFGWRQPNGRIQVDNNVVCHEFGHMFGLIHEHAQPDVLRDGIIVWNDPATIAAQMRRPPNNWGCQTVCNNILLGFNTPQRNGPEFDGESVMLYKLNCNLFKQNGGARCYDRFPSPAERQRTWSAGDYRALAKRYPPLRQAPPPPTPRRRGSSRRLSRSALNAPQPYSPVDSTLESDGPESFLPLAPDPSLSSPSPSPSSSSLSPSSSPSSPATPSPETPLTPGAALRQQQKKEEEVTTSTLVATVISLVVVVVVLAAIVALVSLLRVQRRRSAIEVRPIRVSPRIRLGGGRARGRRQPRRR